MICKCNREVKLRHPRINRCRCGISYDRNGRHIGGQYDGSKVKPAEINSGSTADVSNAKYANKPGSALESLIPDWVVQFKKGCGCKDYSKKMDRWGTDGCIAREKEIVGHLMGQSDKLIPIFRGIPKSLREAAAKKLLAKAIEISRKV